MSAAARYSFAVPLIVGSSQFMHQFDGVAIATALPAMARSMGENPLHLNLAITCYLLALAVFVPVSAWMADRYGAKRVYMLAIVVFTSSSVACALSESLAMLTPARIIQGLGGAMMTPVGRMIVVRTAPRSDIVKALTYITIPAAMAPLFGPSVGGFIVTYFSWHWIFLINVPIGLAGLALVWWKIPDVASEPPGPLDVWGCAVLSTGIASLMLGFVSMGRGFFPTPVIAALIVAGFLLGVLYVLQARGKEHPVVDLNLLRIRTFRSSILAGGLFFMTTTAFVFLLALLLQLGLGYSAFAAGATTLAGAAGSLLTRFIIRKALAWMGFRSLLTANGLTMVVYLLICASFSVSTSYFFMLGVLFVGGISRSAQFAAVQSMAYADMPRSSMSRATSFSSMAQLLAQSFGVGLAAIVIHASQLWRGAENLASRDIVAGFFFLALLATMSLLMFARLPSDAGAALGPDRERADDSSGPLR